MPVRPSPKTRRLLASAAALLACAALSACPSSAPPAGPPPASSASSANGATTAAAPVVKGPVAAPAMHLNAQAVLVVPMQSVESLPWNADRVTAEILDALGERDQSTTWIRPERLRRSLAGSPGYAPDPAHLPADPFMHHNERTTIEPLAGILRRYGALVDARLVLVPQRAQWLTVADHGAVRLSATMVDTRTGRVVWFGEADGKVGTAPDEESLATAAAALAERMLAAPPS